MDVDGVTEVTETPVEVVESPVETETVTESEAVTETEKSPEAETGDVSMDKEEVETPVVAEEKKETEAEGEGEEKKEEAPVPSRPPPEAPTFMPEDVTEIPKLPSALLDREFTGRPRASDIGMKCRSRPRASDIGMKVCLSSGQRNMSDTDALPVCSVKEMFTDFVVEEVLKDGTIAVVTDKTDPFPKAVEVPSTPPTCLSEEVRTDIAKWVEDKENKEEFPIPGSFDKEERTQVHKWIRKTYEGMVDSKYDTDDEKFTLSKKRTPVRARRAEWPKDIPSFTTFTMKKTNMEQQYALRRLCTVIPDPY
ncbi:pseudouridine synthase, TruD, partial [Kipferlia bialata]|eukprot:g8823.t1